jgi:hypothetical protein
LKRFFLFSLFFRHNTNSFGVFFLCLFHDFGGRKTNTSIVRETLKKRRCYVAGPNVNSDHVFPMFYVGNTIIPRNIIYICQRRDSFLFRFSVRRFYCKDNVFMIMMMFPLGGEFFSLFLFFSFFVALML